jgi:DNA adenine methylase
MSASSSPVAAEEPIVAEPFLKWAGGKRQLLPELLKRVPKTYGRYWEPFLGAGALFFALRPEKATLCDTNDELITTWRAVRDDVEGVIDLLSTYTYDAAWFEKMRKSRPGTEVGVAARMIYLNRTCFNGLYRVNRRGDFNVPFGRYKNPTICQADRLRACAAALALNDDLTVAFALSKQLFVRDFRSINPEPGDFVYFDPPYMPLNATSDFTSYTADGFTEKDQLDLMWFAGWLKRKGVHVLITNSSAARRLYARRGFEIETVFGTRRVNSKADQRGAVKELVIT